MTIFLTTQYLEEADSLAHRVGIIDEGKLAAEGPPAHLKRTVGSDIIIAEIEGDMSAAHSAVRNIEGVSAVEAHETELTISVENGPGSISSVALALHDSEITPNNLTLRTPHARRRVSSALPALGWRSTRQSIRRRPRRVMSFAAAVPAAERKRRPGILLRRSRGGRQSDSLRKKGP